MSSTTQSSTTRSSITSPSASRSSGSQYLPARAVHAEPSRAAIALDLSSLGVADQIGDIHADLPVASADLPKLAAYARAAHRGGVSFVSLDDTFRLRTDAPRRPDAWLDPVLAAQRIAGSTGSARLVTSVELGRADQAVGSSLAKISAAAGTWAGLQVASASTASSADLRRAVDGVVRSATGAVAGRAARRPKVVVPVRTEADLPLAGGVGDIVRVREADLHWARELRYAVRSAAHAEGRDVRVLVDLHTVISEDVEAARARAELLEDIADGTPSWDGALRTIGTATDAAALIARWLEAGAADGFVILPGSIPADVLALLRDVLPELRKHDLVAGASVASSPVVRRPAAA